MSFCNIKYFLAILLFLSLNCVVYADQDHDFLNYKKIEDVQRTLRQFNDEKFNAYLVDTSRYCFEEYYAAICKMFVEYKNNFSKMNSCIQNSAQLEQEYNKQWLDGLLKLAGREYVIDHMIDIQRLISNINAKHYRCFCIGNEKDVIYSEIHCILVVKEFLKLYISYVQKMPVPEQKLHSKKLILANTIMKSMENPPVQKVIYSQLGSYLQVIHNVNLRSDVIEYMLNHPTFSKPFDFVKAIKDLKTISAK